MDFLSEYEALLGILSSVLIPKKRFSKSGLHCSEECRMVEAPVLNGLNAFDMIRYLFASKFNLKAAAVKIRKCSMERSDIPCG
jgi:hypothetical protein